MGIVNTVRVLPSQPILVAEAVEYDTGAAAEFTVIEPEAIGVAVADGEVFLTDTHWVEVPEPIMWDGEDETADAITDMFRNAGTAWSATLGIGGRCDIHYTPWEVAGSYLFDDLNIGDSITVNGRWPFVIRGEGDER